MAKSPRPDCSKYHPIPPPVPLPLVLSGKKTRMETGQQIVIEFLHLALMISNNLGVRLLGMTFLPNPTTASLNHWGFYRIRAVGFPIYIQGRASYVPLDLAVLSMDNLTSLESLDQEVLNGVDHPFIDSNWMAPASPQNPSTTPALDSVPDWFLGQKDFPVSSPDTWGHDIPDFDGIASVFPQSPSAAPVLDPVSGIGGNSDWFLGQQGLSCPHVSGDDSDWITPFLPENPSYQQGKVHRTEGDTQHVTATVRSSLFRGTHTPKNRNSRVEVLYPKYQY
ncbi:hypothetical protein B0H11DRAFT_1924674 [Mycena galericulata]|nr:hypothetical protein B0H11DRAFT_1924674 [Mycena galericulata]